MNVVACLMVRNESRVIRRCLDSLRGKVRDIVAVDTGSTDDTLKIVSSFAFDFRINTYQRPWVNFGYNRTEALKTASLYGDYVLMVDADMTLEGEFPLMMGHDAYRLVLRQGSLAVANTFLVKSGLPWRYVGATHEYLTCGRDFTTGHLTSPVLIEHADSSRRLSGRKLPEDAELLEAELKKNPNDPRTVFYLARTYDDLYATQANNQNDFAALKWRGNAIASYRRRSEMQGYIDEIFYSEYRMGCLELSSSLAHLLLLHAWQICPHRWEPVQEACKQLNQQQLYQASYALSKQLLSRPADPTGLFVSQDVYDYLLLFEHSISAYWVGEYQESLEANERLLAKELPDWLRVAVERNVVFARDKVT